MQSLKIKSKYFFLNENTVYIYIKNVNSILVLEIFK